MALPGASVMSVARPTSVRHCAVTVKSMHGAFVLVVVGSQMCAVAHPGTHAPRGRRCCAGVTPGFQESCCCVQPINSGFRLQVFRSIVQRHCARKIIQRGETTVSARRARGQAERAANPRSAQAAATPAELRNAAGSAHHTRTRVTSFRERDELTVALWTLALGTKIPCWNGSILRPRHR